MKNHDKSKTRDCLIINLIYASILCIKIDQEKSEDIL